MKVKAAVINYAAIRIDDVSSLLSWDDLQSRFYKALQTLTKSDCLYLSRTINITDRQIQRWKAGEVMKVDLYHIFSTIAWVENGKRIEKIDDEDFIPWLN